MSGINSAAQNDHPISILQTIGHVAKKNAGGGDWQKKPNVALKISVGAEYHEKEKLAAALIWALERFSKGKCFICIADTLQHYNLMENEEDGPRALRHAKKAGVDWKERNVPIIKEVVEAYFLEKKINRAWDDWIVFKHWDEWLADPRYDKASKLLTDVEAMDDSFVDALNRTIQDYLRRNNIKEGDANYKFKENQSRIYLTEELRVFTFWQEDLNAAEVYPRDNLIIEDEIEEHNILYLPMSLAQRPLVKLDIVRKKNHPAHAHDFRSAPRRPQVRPKDHTV